MTITDTINTADSTDIQGAAINGHDVVVYQDDVAERLMNGYLDVCRTEGDEADTDGLFAYIQAACENDEDDASLFDAVDMYNDIVGEFRARVNEQERDKAEDAAIEAIKSADTLDSLCDGLNAAREIAGDGNDFDSLVWSALGRDLTDLPTFGGAEPNDTSNIWSWDAARVITTDGAGDFVIEDMGSDKRGEIERFQAIENAGYEGERVVNTSNDFMDLSRWIERSYSVEESERLHVAIARINDDGTRTFET